MTTRTIQRARRPAAPRVRFRVEGAEPLTRRDRHPAHELGIGLDFERERMRVDRWLERERMHVERVVPAPGALVLDAQPNLWALRNWLVALAVIAIVLAFALVPRPTVTSSWNGQGIVGRSYVVTPTPYDGPAVIAGDAAPLR